MIGLIERLFFSLGLVHAHIFLSFLLLLALLDTDKKELETDFLIYVLQLGFLIIIIIIIYYLFGANIYMNIFKCALQVTLK